MAAIRLHDKPDKIERALTTALLDGGPLSRKRSIEFASDPLASSTWEEVLLPTPHLDVLWFRMLQKNTLEYFIYLFIQVSPKDTLITPVQCKSIWRQFKAETEYSVVQAMSMQV